MGLNLKSVFFCALCIFLIQGYASEFNAESLYEKLADVMFENELLPLKFKLEEATKKIEKQAEIINKLEKETADKMEKQADRITNLEEATSKIEKQDDKITKLEEKTTDKMEKQADRITNLEDGTSKIEKQADKITRLEEETTDKMEKQADRITYLEEATSKIEKQADKITKLEEETTYNMDKQADRITNLEKATSKIEKQADKITKLEEETTDKMEKQAERITNLEEATSKIEKQADKVTKLEEETEKNVKRIENMTIGGASSEKAIQSLNNQLAQLENNTLNNEKAISKMTLMAKENKLKAINESKSSVQTVQDVAKKQYVAVRKMLYAVKQSFHNKFITLKKETKLQLSAMNTSVESQISSFKTFLKLTENNVSETLNYYSKDMNETFSNLNEEMRIFGDEYERKLESLRGETDKVLNQYKTNLNEANGDIQELQKTMMKVEERQDRTTIIGEMINDYLGCKKDVEDHAVHLLFSANRWERVPMMLELLNKGTTLIVDRYAYSGVAFTAAKPGFNIDWCKQPDIALPKPDAVLYLTLSSEAAAKRGGFGEERYEQTDFQKTVAGNFELLKDESWQVIDADKSVEDLHRELLDICRKTIQDIGDKPVYKLWAEGKFVL